MGPFPAGNVPDGAMQQKTVQWVEVNLVGNSSRPDKVEVSYRLLDAAGNEVRDVAHVFTNRAGETLIVSTSDLRSRQGK